MKMDILHESCWGEIKTRKGRNVFLSSEMKMTIFEFQFSSSPAEKKLSTFFPIFDKTRNLKWKPWNLPRLFNSMSSFPFHPLSQNPPSIKTSSKEIFLFIKNPAPSLLNLSWKALTLKLFNENFFWIKKHFFRKTKKWQSAIQLICLACLFRRGVEPRKGLTRVLKQHD